MITTPFLILYSGIIIIIFYLYEIKKNITSPDFYYMTVYLCVRPDDQPNDISNQWLMERFLSFRIIPRIGDSLVVPIWANKLPTVTEIKRINLFIPYSSVIIFIFHSIFIGTILIYD